jgi:fermentation-respiration switch protein FrsA (DUF1100 family)
VGGAQRERSAVKIANFIIRLVVYALLLGLTAWEFGALWSSNGLDAVGALRSFHDKATLALRVAPLVLALGGVGSLRQVAVFLAFYLVGAALTAPLVCARIAGL